MVSNFSIKFHPVGAGWGSFKVVADSREVVIVTSASFAPYADLMDWIERIIDGHAESMIEIDEEGPIKAMIVKRNEDGSRVNFIVKDHDFPEEPRSKEYINILIEEDVLISEFLSKYIDFFETIIDPKGWYLRDVEMLDVVGLLKNLERKYRAGR